MTSNSRVPQLLAPYVANVPKDSLILLTSTLSNSVNWLVIRCLCGAFSNDAVKAREAPPLQEEHGGGTATTTQDVGVVLVSWMRDWEFWKTETRRAGGLDLASLSQSKRFAFVNGLGASSSPPQTPTAPQSRTSQLSSRPAPSPSSTLPSRNPVPVPVRSQAPTATSMSPVAPPVPSQTYRLSSLDFAAVRKSIEGALSSLNTASAILILDSPDILLALQDPTVSSETSSVSGALQKVIFSLRLHPRTHATIINLSSDINPLPSAIPEHHISSPLESESQALLVGVAHTADLIISARGLDTGAAGDVSGVLRITRSSAADEEDAGRKAWKEQELLYLVKNDGSAKVWERGAGVGVG